MGGAIGLSSNVNDGVGAEFWFTIPVKIYESNETRQVRVIFLVHPSRPHLLVIVYR
jgi:hypothetical protein